MKNFSDRKRKRPKLKTAKSANGRPPLEPTDEERAQVQALCGFGLSEEAVADYLQVSKNSLRKHFEPEIRRGRVALMALASGTLVHHLQKKDFSAAKFVHERLGRQFGWRTDEPRVLTQRRALQMMFAKGDFSRLSNRQFKELVELLAISGINIPNPIANAE